LNFKSFPRVELVTRGKYKSLFQVSFKFGDSKKIFYQIIFKFKHRSFSEFSLKIHFYPEEVPMEKVLPLFKPFKPIFYFKFVEFRKVLFGSVKV
jgi:hypothetical protein